MEESETNARSQHIDILHFLKDNIYYIFAFVLLANFAMIYGFINIKKQYESRISFTIIASTDATNLLCGGDKSCWNEMFFNKIKSKFPSAALVNNLSPSITMTGYDTTPFYDLGKAMQMAADAVNAEILKESQANIIAYENEYPKELLGTDAVAQRYLRTKAILGLYSQGEQLPVTVGEPAVSSRTNNLSVWISSGTIIGALLGSVFAIGLRRLRGEPRAKS